MQLCLLKAQMQCRLLLLLPPVLSRMPQTCIRKVAQTVLLQVVDGDTFPPGDVT
jgi:hypothetical protein